MYKNSVLSDELAPDYLQGIHDFVVEWTNQKEIIHVMTSGSTGVPKQLELLKEKVRVSAKATGQFFDFQSGQTMLLNLSSNYIAGKLMIVRAIEHDMKLIIAPNQANPLLNIADDVQIDFGAFVPYQLKAILANDKTRMRYENIKKVIIGGAPLSDELERDVQKLKNETYATFGMTETITHFALKNVSKHETYYTCLNGFSISEDKRGCLVLNENLIVDEKTVTNDLITVKNKHQFTWNGRIDYVVNSGGVKLSPELIEKKVAHLFPENRFYFIGRKSEQFGEEIILYIEGEMARESHLKKLMNEVLNKYEQPKEICLIQKFEETHTGKVKRRLF